MHDTGSEAAPDWDALVAPIARTQPWRGDAERAEGSPDPGWAGRGFSRPGPDPAFEREPRREAELEAGS